MKKVLIISLLLGFVSCLCGCEVYQAYSKNNIYNSKPKNYQRAQTTPTLNVPSSMTKPDYSDTYALPR